MLFKKSKDKEPLPAKSVGQLPHSLEGLSYNDWRDKRRYNHKWRNIRWAVVLGLSLLFMLSFMLDLSILEGSLSGSRLVGFYLIDPFNTLQLLSISARTGFIVMLTMNFWIGLMIIVGFYAIMGGRTYCSWVCPYHLLAEWVDKLRDFMVKRFNIKNHTFDRSLRYVFWVGFILLAFATSSLVFEVINVVGIISRALIYGPGLILLWIVALLFFELLYSKRFWCSYVCPVGTTMSMVGKVSPMVVQFDLDKCGYCGECLKMCEVPHVLWFTKRGKATQKIHTAGADCTRCGYCVDRCPGKALTYSFKGIDKLT